VRRTGPGGDGNKNVGRRAHGRLKKHTERAATSVNTNAAGMLRLDERMGHTMREQSCTHLILP
jgi:hypothetical protein